MYDPYILLDIKGQLYLEPLSRRYVQSRSLGFPGRLKWLPPELEQLEKLIQEKANDPKPDIIQDTIASVPQARGLTCSVDGATS